MNLTHRQITLIVASILVYKEEFDGSSVSLKKELDEIIELLDEEHQNLVEKDI